MTAPAPNPTGRGGSPYPPDPGPAYPPALIIRELPGERSADWDAFVRRTPGGLPHHLYAWRNVMSQTYGFQTHYLFAQQGQEIRGVLPLIIVPSRLTGKRLMSMPGGLCAADEEAAVHLLDGAAHIAREQHLGRIVIQDSRRPWAGHWQTEQDHVFWVLPLPDEEETLWRQLDGNIRRQVRKARQNGLRVQVDRRGDLLGAFYDVFSHFTHQAGTPVFGIDFLQRVISAFPQGFNIVVVRYEDRPIAGYFQLEMDDTMYGMWGAALPEFQSLRPAYLAIWEIMSDAIENGIAVLDMGRSPAGSNASKFKGQWGGVQAPVYQLVRRLDGGQAQTTLTGQVRSDRRFQTFIRIWPRLPYALTTQIGPKLRRHVPFA